MRGHLATRGQATSRRTFLRHAGLMGAGAVVSAGVLGRLDPIRLAYAQPTSGTVRIGIRGADGALEAGAVEVSGDGIFTIRSSKGDGDVLKLDGNQIATIAAEGDTFRVAGGGKSAMLAGSVQVASSEAGAAVLQVVNGKGYPYRGRFDVTAGVSGGVVLVNVLDVDSYVAGVAAKEISPSFGIEPLRAQAIAARSYAFGRRASGIHKNLGIDVCDSQHCQVYGGMVAEHPLGNGAVEATSGMILLRSGAVFEPMYSSTCGGHTESISRAFGNGSDDEAVADGELPAGGSLLTEAGAMTFFKGVWASNCAGSNRYRWSYTWDRSELEAAIAAGLQRFAGNSSLSSSGTDERVASVTGISIAERGVSGRALALKVEAPGVEWTVKRALSVQNFLRAPDGSPLPSSAFALEQVRGGDGKLAGVIAYGAGWGHGAGMCQWGMRGLAQKGLAYDAILGHYYPSADIAKVSV